METIIVITALVCMAAVICFLCRMIRGTAENIENLYNYAHRIAANTQRFEGRLMQILTERYADHALRNIFKEAEKSCEGAGDERERKL